MSAEATATNDSIWDMCLFVERQVAQAFACGNCHNIPRQCINDGDGKIYCEFCVAQLKMSNTRANSAIDKIIESLKVKCINVNTKVRDKKDADPNAQQQDADDDKKWDNEEDHSKDKKCGWSGTLNQWKKHNDTQCPFAKITCKYCGKHESMRYIMVSEHQETCDEVALMCELGCGQQFFRKEMKAHLSIDCVEQTLTCEQCHRDDIKRKDLESHLESECSERAVVCKYAAYGCSEEEIRSSLLEEHYKECAVSHLELKMESMVKGMEKKLNSAMKTIEHLKYRNCKLQMQIHQKQTLKDDFFIIFESIANKNSFISAINFRYNSSVQNVHLVKSLNPRKDNIIYKRVKDTSYCFAPNVVIDKIIGITSKSKQQHIASCVSAMANCICTFNVMYRIGGDSMHLTENHNICNILGTDVVFALPQLLIPRFNHRVIYSAFHGILCVGGEPIKKEDARRELEAVDKENESKSRKKDGKNEKNRKAILNAVEQLNLAPTPALTHYYNVRNMNIKKDEEKLQMPPEPELKWRNLGSNMKYRRDCPSVALWKAGHRHEEQLFVAGGWNEKDLSCVEMYNFRSREWKTLASLNVKRNSAGICEWKQKNNNMIIVGGWNKKTTTSVEEYDAHKNQWYVLKSTNHAHKYYPACTVYHDLNPFINAGNGVIVVVGNDGRMYGDEYIKKQQHLMKQKDKESDIPKNIVKQSNANDITAAMASTVKDDWGFIEFYDPREWIRKWTVIDNLPSFLNLTDDQCKKLYFQSIVPCPHTINTNQ